MSEDQIIEDLLTRGVENIIPSTDELSKLLKSGKKINCYLGIDPTATKIHIGHAFPLRKLQHMVNLGHNVTFLIGSYTALVGDTSDKNDERPMLTMEQIEDNLKAYKAQASKFLDFDKVTLVHNGDWLSKLTFKDVLDISSNFSVNDFTSRELIRKRLDAGKRVSLPETLYPLMQGYDSYYLDTDIQFGGTDQTFNMQAGRTLNKRLRDKESFIIANGFLPGTDGRKMSKSWGNAIWIEDEPNDIFGKVMRINDEVIHDYFIYGTSLPLNDVKSLEDELLKAAPMKLKKTLAHRITLELYDEQSANQAQKHFETTIQQKSAADDAETVNVKPSLKTAEILDIVLDKQLVPSKSQAKRLLEQNAIRLNENVIEEGGTYQIEESSQLRVGKRNYLILNPKD